MFGTIRYLFYVLHMKTGCVCVCVVGVYIRLCVLIYVCVCVLNTDATGRKLIL